MALASSRFPTFGIAVACALALLLPLGGLVLPGLEGPSGSEIARDAVSARAEAPGATLSPITMTGVSPAAASLEWIRSLDLCFREYELAYSTAGALGPWTTWATYPDVNTVSAFVYGFASGTSVWWRLTDRACDGTEVPTEAVVPHPAAATLAYRAIDATSGEFTWDNHAVYGGRLGFDRYELKESVNGGPWTVAATILDSGTRSHVAQGLSSASGYSFYLITTDACRDCASGPSPSRTSSNTVSFGSPQPIAARAEASRTSADVGQTVSFVCAASGGTGPYAYGWAFGDGTSAAGASASHAYAEPGPKRATCTATDSVSARTTSSVDLEVSPAPSVTASVDHPAAAPDTLLTFTMSPSGGPGTFPRHDWSFGDGSVGSGATATHAYTSPGSYAASAIVTDGNGGTASGYVVVSITHVDVEAASSTTGAAPGESIDFTASASGGGGGPYTFAWDFGDGTTETGAAVSHAYGSAGDYGPVVTATDGLGADGTAELPTIGVGGPLVAGITFAPAAPLTRQPVSLRAMPRGGAGGYTCAWTYGNGESGAGCDTTHAWASEGTYPVAVTVVDRSGDSVVSEAEVTVRPALAVTIEMSPDAPAPGQSVAFTAVPSGGAGPYGCTWSFETSEGTSTGCETTHAWERPGTYRVSLVVNDTEGQGVIEIRTVQVGSTGTSVFGMNPLLPIGAAIAAGVALALWRMRSTARKDPEASAGDGEVLESIDAFVGSGTRDERD